MKYILIFLSLFSCVSAHEIAVRSPSGQVHVVNINPEDPFCYILDQIEGSIAEAGDVITAKKDFWIDYSLHEKPVYKKVKSTKPVRSYPAGISHEEKKQIAYIVNTLARASLPEIIAKKSSIKRAGDKVDHVHPLHFTATIFGDEELKAGIHAIRGRVSWIWNGFMDGLSTSLKEEAAVNNLKPEFIADFCARLGISPDLVMPALSQHRWEEFVDILITNIPRDSKRGRYGI